MPANSTKRQKLNNEESRITANTKECVTFDTVSERDYPIDLISGNLLRMLSYEGIQGAAELISFLIRCAGCNAEFELDSEFSASQFDAWAEQIESSSLNAVPPPPAAYAIQKHDFAKRVIKVLKEVFGPLVESENVDVLNFCCNAVASLSRVHLQSLRYVSTIFLGAMLSSHEESETESRQILSSALEQRCADVAVIIRRRAVTDLALFLPSQSERALYDLNSSVRLAALRSLDSRGKVSTEVRDRVVQMAYGDVDLPVRKAALRYLVAAKIEVEDEEFNCMLLDEDDISRKFAAEIIVYTAAAKTTSPQSLLVSLAENLPLTSKSVVSDAIAHGLEKVRSKFHVQWPVELVTCLNTDFEKESRKSRSASTKQLNKLLATKLNNASTQKRLLLMLNAMLRSKSMGSALILENAVGLFQKVQYNTDLLSLAINAFSYLDYEVLMNRTDTEREALQLFDTCRDIFMEHGNSREVVEAVAVVFAAIPSGKRTHFLEDLYQDLRIKLASLLGPQGDFSSKKQVPVDTVMQQLIILGRYVDINDLSKLPLWNSLNRGHKMTLQLVRAIGMKGDSHTVNLVVQKLSERKSGPAVDDILRILVVAKMREVDVDFDLPIEINETGPTSQRAWRAAVAAGVV